MIRILKPLLFSLSRGAYLPEFTSLAGRVHARIAILLLATIVIVAAVYAVARGVDVRLALLAAAFALAGLRGDVAPIFVKFISTFSDEQYVVPICTAMGFAYVLKHTGCDQHLVQLLTRPLRFCTAISHPRRRPRWVPGQYSRHQSDEHGGLHRRRGGTANAGGPVIEHDNRREHSPGASIGGELLNPGAPELNTVAKQLSISPTEVVPSVIPLVLPTPGDRRPRSSGCMRLRAERKAGPGT